MKRLLAYLFIVLVLELVVNNFAFAECIKGNCINGQGTYLFTNGAKYVGGFKNGEFHGQGTVTWSDGSTYVGEFKDGKFHGQGTYTWANGNKYVGEWKDRKKHGQGTFTYADGRVENGIWKRNKLVKRNNIKTQIAKVEPSQTQEVAEKKKSEEKKKLKQKLITLSKCYAKSETGTQRFTGPWIKVWGVKKSFQSDVFIKNQYIIDLDTLEIWHNYRFTDEYHKILVGDNKSKVKALSSENQKKVKHLEIPQERKNKIYSEESKYAARYDDVNQLIVYEIKFSDTSYFTSDKKKNMRI